jgi:hypothetical protein
MPQRIALKYYLATRDQPIAPGDEIWGRPLPTQRQPGQDVNDKTVACGDYLSAVSRFLEKDNYRTVATALKACDPMGAGIERVRCLSVFLVKHGEFYHPVRVVVEGPQKAPSFVVNGAISTAGREHIVQEFKLLAGLYAVCGKPVIPRVFHLEEIVSADGDPIPMFSAQWFDGFCEFHLTAEPSANSSNLIVWNPDDTTYHLTPQQAEDVFRQAAWILTTSYNFYTFEHISAWHHAAGDFILKPVDAARVDLRLITIRKYTPLIENPDPDPADMVAGLLLFLIHLSIRNRLDRLDGTGELAWADDYALRGTIEGFFSGLDALSAKMDLPDTFPREFKNYINAHPPDALRALFKAVVAKTPNTASEYAFVKTQLDNHMDLFRTLLAPR